MSEQKTTSAKLGMYDPNDPSFKVYYSFLEEVGPLKKERILGIKEGMFFYFSPESKDKEFKINDQFEVPLEAFKWIIACMQRFKLPGNLGGYPQNQFTDFLFLSTDCNLSIFRGLHHGLGQQYFAIRNNGRTSYFTDRVEQEWEVFDVTVNEHNLEAVFAQILKDYEDGKI